MFRQKYKHWLLSIIIVLAIVSIGFGLYFYQSQSALKIVPPAPADVTNDNSKNTVIIVSWDGAKPSVMKQLLDDGRLPTFALMQGEGVFTLSAQTVVPSITLPAHASMLTGRPIEQHLITWNSYSPDKGHIQTETVFELASQAGITTAAIVNKEKLWHLNKPGTIDTYRYSKGSIEVAVNEAIEVMAEAMPGLAFIHLKEPDGSGHLHGWGNDSENQPVSQGYIDALIEADRVTGLLVSYLKSSGNWNETVLIITSDHGGIGHSHGSSDPEDTTIPWLAAGGRVISNWTLREPVSIMDTAATTLALLGIAIPSEWKGRNVLRVMAE